MKSGNMKISQEALLLIGLIIILIIINQNPMLSAVVAFFIVYIVAFTTTRDFTKSFLAAILIMLLGLMWRRSNLSKEFFYEGMKNQSDDENDNINSNPNQIVRIDETQITEETEPSNEDESESNINKLIDGSATGNSGLSSEDVEYFNGDEVTSDSMGIDPNDIISPDLDDEKAKKEKSNSELLADKPINAMNPAEVQREMFRHINVTKQLTEALENLSPVLQQGQGVLKAFENLKMGKNSGAKSFADNLRDIDSLLGTKKN